MNYFNKGGFIHTYIHIHTCTHTAEVKTFSDIQKELVSKTTLQKMLTGILQPEGMTLDGNRNLH